AEPQEQGARERGLVEEAAQPVVGLRLRRRRGADDSVEQAEWLGARRRRGGGLARQHDGAAFRLGRSRVHENSQSSPQRQQGPPLLALRAGKIIPSSGCARPCASTWSALPAAATVSARRRRCTSPACPGSPSPAPWPPPADSAPSSPGSISG